MVRYNFKIFTVSVFLLFLVSFTPSLLADQKVSNQPSKTEVIQKTQKLQIPFIANDGQTNEKVKFYANTFGGTVFVTKDGEIVYSLPNNGSDVETQCLASLMHSSKGIRDEDSMLHDYHVSGIMHPASWIVGCGSKSDFQNHTKSTSSDSKNLKSSNSKSAIQNLKSEISGIALREEFVGAKVKTIQGKEKSVTNVNYFKGKDTSKWKTNISTYETVSIGKVYKGIELKLKAYGNNVEKLFCVKPGADPDQIKIKLSGIFPIKKGGRRGLSVNERGELEVETGLGPVKFTKPVAYQEIDGKRVEIECGYVITDCGMQDEAGSRKQKAGSRKQETGQIGKRLIGSREKGMGRRGAYLASNSQLSTENLQPETQNPSPDTRHQASSLATHHSSPIYGFTVASYDKTKDLIIDPLLASTFLGGYSSDYGHSVAIDSDGNIYVAGQTGSSDFPTTTGTYQTSYKGYNSDAFIAKLNGDLTNLLASTYLGGDSGGGGYSSGYYNPIDMAMDSNGDIYVAGKTNSSTFPTTADAYDISYNGSHDVFVSKLNGTLTNLTASTFLGGTGDDQYIQSIAIASDGNIYIVGYTGSSDFPTTTGAYDTSYGGAGGDIFISKLKGDLSSLLASTYLGGSDADYA